MIKQIEPKLALDILAKDKNSLLIDVRTEAEFNFVGTVDSSALINSSLLLPWLTFPTMQENGEFKSKFENSLQLISSDNYKDLHLFFICKTGGRSNSAAQFASDIGYKNCYNIVNGFEGDIDHNNHRGNINGWKADKLPWKQN